MRERPSDPIRDRRSEALKQTDLSAAELNVVRDLKKPLKSIIEQLKPEIERGAYRLILGDDASGRIPAFIVGHVCKAIYEKNGIPPAQVRLIAGSTRLTGPALEEKRTMVTQQIAKIRRTVAQTSPDDLGKVLIVTDTISGGNSVGFLLMH